MAVFLIYTLNALFLFLTLKIAFREKPEGPGPLGWWALSLLLLADAVGVLWVECSLASVAALVVTFTLCATVFPDAPMKALGESFGRAKFPVFLLSVATVSVLAHIHLPIMTFLSSPGEVGLHLNYLLTTNATHSMVVVYLAVALYGLAASARIRTALAAGALSTITVFLLYAFVLPFGYPQMNGLMFEQVPVERHVLAFRAAIDLCVVALGIVGLLWFIRKRGAQPAIPVLLLLNASFIVASAYSTSTNDLTPKADEETETAQPAGTALFRYSQNEPNVLIILLDRFMGSFVEGFVEEEPALAARLEGFVWYPRSISAGESSITGVHPVFGSYDYTPTEMNKRNLPLREVSAEAFSLLPHNFVKAGWEVNWVNPRGLDFTMRGDCSALKVPGVNCLKIPVSLSQKRAGEHGISVAALSAANYADLLVMLGAMRGAPYMLKVALTQRGPWGKSLGTTAASTYREWAELKALPELSTASAKKPNINLFINSLPHEPLFMGQDCLPKTIRQEASPEELKARGFDDIFGFQHEVAARCALLLMADYFDWMRAEGVYDNTQIVLVSDHGIVGPIKDRNRRAVEGGTTANNYVRTRSLLMVKESQAKGPMQISESFMPNAEVPRIVCEQIGGCVNPYLNGKIVAAHGRDDPFQMAFGPWQFSLQNPRSFKIRERLDLVGKDPFVAENWRRMPTD